MHERMFSLANGGIAYGKHLGIAFRNAVAGPCLCDLCHDGDGLEINQIIPCLKIPDIFLSSRGGACVPPPADARNLHQNSLRRENHEKTI